jgi:hypothetical protein
MTVQEAIPAVLLLLTSLAFSVGATMVVLLIRRSRSKNRVPFDQTMEAAIANPAFQLPRPSCWLAIKSQNLLAVQTALGLHNPKPCSWMDGFEEKLFIAPPVNGWILVFGSRLPEPNDDVDVCFRFVLNLSRKLGHVQWFSASRILNHHAWVRAESGRVIRAYAWAGKTLWTQGRKTAAERDLDLKCFDYEDAESESGFGTPEGAAANVDKVPLLAARWSLDPAQVEERFVERGRGVAGEPSRRY